jgi:spermidine synthase
LLFALVGLAAAGGVLTMRALPGIAAQTRAPLIDALGDAQAGSLLAEGVCAMLVLGPITVVMGALFSHLAQASRHAGGGVGEAMGVNTLFGALGPVVFGVVLLPLVGARGALIACVAGYAVLAVLVGRRGLPAAVIVAVAAAAATPGELRHVTLPPGGTLGAYHEGVLGAVSVVNEADGERVLKVNDKFAMGGTRTMFPERRQAHLPIMLRTGLVDEPLAARAAGEEDAGPRVLFLGVGTGATMAGAAAHEPDLAVGVELVPEIIGVLPRFAKVNAALGWGESPDVDGGKAARARDAMAATVKPFHLVAADARRYVRASDRLYDVIIADLFHPARDGAGALYTREHFAAIRDRLAPGGVFCQWLPLHQMDLETVRIVVRTYLEVYEEPVALLAHFNTNTPMLGLAARGDGEPLVFREGALRRAAPTLAKRLALRDVALSNDMTFAGTLVAGPRTLRALSQASAVNTDDKPIVVFRAPARAYDASIPHWRTLADLLEATSPRAGEVLPTDADPAFRERLNAYWSARERFLEGRILDASDRHPEALRAYLEAAGRSEDFRTAYEVVLLRARDLAATDRFTARGLLEELERRVPSRTEARQLRLELFGR